ncbi:uncharacterized protein ACBT44_010925 [Syngnathus typhle]
MKAHNMFRPLEQPAALLNISRRQFKHEPERISGREKLRPRCDKMFPSVCLLATWVLLLLPLQALDLRGEEVKYVTLNATVTAGGSVRLDCGTDPPSIFIWGFTRAGSDSNVALAYDYGHGLKLQARPDGVVGVRVPVNTSALVLEKVRREAEGTYTCQALYHAARVTFYYTRLDVDDD